MNGDTLGESLARTDPAAYGAERPRSASPASPPVCTNGGSAASTSPSTACCSAAIDDCGYPCSPNLDKFLAQARDAAARMSLDEFVAELALVREENPREPDAPPEDSANAVKIMTVHSAKGLEFPVVFVAAIHKGVDTGVPVVAFSRHHGLGARWRNPASGKDKDDLYQRALRQEWRSSGRGREQPAALRRDDARRAASGAQLLCHGPQARQLGQTGDRAPCARPERAARPVGGLPRPGRPSLGRHAFAS